MMTALELAEALVKLDDDHNCRLCKKTEWGEGKHDLNCPMRFAYQIIREEQRALYGEDEDPR